MRYLGCLPISAEDVAGEQKDQHGQKLALPTRLMVNWEPESGHKVTNQMT